MLILHHDKLKICQARELPKWVFDYRNKRHRRKTTNVAKGPWYRRPIFRLMRCSWGLGAGLRLPLKLCNSFKRRLARGERDGVANASDTSIAFVKPELPLVLWYSVTSVKIGFTPSVWVREVRRSGSCPHTTVLTDYWS